MAQRPRSGVRPFNPPEECVAFERLEFAGTLMRSDFGSARRFFEAGNRGGGGAEPTDDFLESVERQFDLSPGLGQLAWQCANCQSDRQCDTINQLVKEK